jgi:hypothetical protein
MNPCHPARLAFADRGDLGCNTPREADLRGMYYPIWYMLPVRFLTGRLQGCVRLSERKQ